MKEATSYLDRHLRMQLVNSYAIQRIYLFCNTYVYSYTLAKVVVLKYKSISEFGFLQKNMIFLGD